MQVRCQLPFTALLNSRWVVLVIACEFVVIKRQSFHKRPNLIVTTEYIVLFLFIQELDVCIPGGLCAPGLLGAGGGLASDPFRTAHLSASHDT